ncbi:unnamed protein product [Symbiodinium pilosum]|uniref:DRBM domain-containing protein n=1 Tax=Symbiodinium pilosum TaxID=2952 RepID=A0A812U2S3_SYMPI|nr:unnamed protein product [Symbiodinium pilosum]
MNYCERNCFSIRNPYNLPADVVADFLQRYRNGDFGEVDLCSDKVASQAKDLQKKGGTEQWKKYVREKGFKSLDPLSYPESFVQGFIEQFDPQDLDENAPRGHALSSRSILNSALVRLGFARGEVSYQIETRDTKNAKKRANLRLPDRAIEVLPSAMPLEFAGEWQRTDAVAEESAAQEAVRVFKAYGLL